MSNSSPIPECGGDHEAPDRAPADPQVVERAAAFLKAMADEGRLQVLALLARGEACVSEVAEVLAMDISTISHRLRVLRSEGLVRRRREGRHVYYHLEDEHVRHLLEAAIEHAAHETESGRR